MAPKVSRVYPYPLSCTDGDCSPHPPPARPPPPLHPRHLPRLMPVQRLQRRRPASLSQLPMVKRRSAERSARRPTAPTFTRVSAHACLLGGACCRPVPMTVLKQVHPDTGISNKAMAILNSFVNDIFERIATEASSMCHNVLDMILVSTCYATQNSPPTPRNRPSRLVRFKLLSA